MKFLSKATGTTLAVGLFGAAAPAAFADPTADYANSPQQNTTQNNNTVQPPAATQQQTNSGLLMCYSKYSFNQSTGLLSYDYAEAAQCANGTTTQTPDEYMKANYPTYVRTGQEQAAASTTLSDQVNSATTTAEDTSLSASVKTEAKDDYPFKTSACGNVAAGGYVSQVTPLGGDVCQCTDFVAWRINQKMGGDKTNVKFTMSYASHGRSDAKDWPTIYSDVPTDTTPKVGDVAISTTMSQYGHAAYVIAVDGDNVTVEQYNYANAATNYKGLAYSQQTFPKTTFDKYMHFEEVKKYNPSGVKSTSSSSSSTTAEDSTWDKLAQCEASGNWSINTGNGFYGGLQFTPETWAGFGGTEYAASANLATREQQITIAKKVQAVQGWNAWPVCSKKLGLQ